MTIGDNTNRNVVKLLIYIIIYFFEKQIIKVIKLRNDVILMVVYFYTKIFFLKVKFFKFHLVVPIDAELLD